MISKQILIICIAGIAGHMLVRQSAADDAMDSVRRMCSFLTGAHLLESVPTFLLKSVRAQTTSG